MTEAGELWAWGLGDDGRLGLNDGQDRLVPTRVDLQHFAHAPISAVAAGYYHSAAVTAGGALYTWGRGEVPGGLGHVDLANKLMPTLCRGSCWAGRAWDGDMGCLRSSRLP